MIARLMIGLMIVLAGVGGIKALEKIGSLKAELNALEHRMEDTRLESQRKEAVLIAQLNESRDQAKLLDELYLGQNVEEARILGNLELQLEELRSEKGSDCDNAVVSVARIGVLRQPVWGGRENTATSVPVGPSG